MSREPSPQLRHGRRDLVSLPGVELLDDLTWHSESKLWTIHIQLTRNGPDHEHVPRVTDWYIVVGEDYPWGNLKFCPAKENSLIRTFPHQQFNRPYPDDRRWTTGELCLDTTIGALGRHGLEEEPFDAGGRRGRLRWHAARALEWLRLAASNELIKAGDPFEVPYFPIADLADSTVAYLEDTASFQQWQAAPEMFGTVSFAPLAAKKSILAVTGFYTLPGRPVFERRWGVHALSDSKPSRGVWMRVAAPLINEPWQAPTTWSELCKACRASGTELDRLLMKLLRPLRDGQRHVLLLGFPMPEHFSGAHTQLHWQPLKLPVLAQGNAARNGFRAGTEKGRYQLDRHSALANSTELQWLHSENWSPGQLVSRGAVRAGLAGSHVLLLGGGALGSAVAELLIRGGLRKLTLVDGELLQIGNLCRHTLTLADLKAAKAESLASRLRTINPHVDIQFVTGEFPDCGEYSESLSRCDVVLDCTADEAVIHHLGRFPWSGSKRFISLSLGHAARRLFCFVAECSEFPEATFRLALVPWLRKEREELGDAELPREGIGCWHPVFPARADDVSLMASIAVKYIDEMLESNPLTNGLTVFEQRLDGTHFTGVLRIALEATDG